MEELNLDPITLFNLQKDGFLVEKRSLRGVEKYYQYHQDLEAYDKSTPIISQSNNNNLTTKKPKNKQPAGTFVKKRVIKQIEKQQTQRQKVLSREPQQQKRASAQNKAKQVQINTRSHQQVTWPNRKPIKNIGKNKATDISDNKSLIVNRVTRKHSQLGANTPALNHAVLLTQRKKPNCELTTSLSTACKESESNNTESLQSFQLNLEKVNKRQRKDRSPREMTSQLYLCQNISSLTTVSRFTSSAKPLQLGLVDQKKCIKSKITRNEKLNLNPQKQKANKISKLPKETRASRRISPPKNHKRTPSRSLSPNTEERMDQAQEMIDIINHQNLNEKIIRSNKKGPLSNASIQLESSQSGQIHKFKIYTEDSLSWPVQSILIKQSHMIRPKNGENKRISQEQDYESDKEVINSAKQKLKREFKMAIQDHLEESQSLSSSD